MIAALKKVYSLTNLTDGGDGGNGLSGAAHPLYGKPRSQETREKISRALQGVSTGAKGKKRSPISQSHKDAISAKLKGKKKSPEHIAKSVAGFKAAIAIKPRKGAPISEETKKKISAAQIGKSKPMKPRMIYTTPFGEFGTLAAAAKAHGMKSIYHCFYGNSTGKYKYPPKDGYFVKPIGSK